MERIASFLGKDVGMEVNDECEIFATCLFLWPILLFFALIKTIIDFVRSKVCGQ